LHPRRTAYEAELELSPVHPDIELVPHTGIEPARLSTVASKTTASAHSANGALIGAHSGIRTQTPQGLSLRGMPIPFKGAKLDTSTGLAPALSGLQPDASLSLP
jgi:hypothetical protein